MDIGSRAYESVFDTRWYGASDVPVPLEVIHDLCDHFGYSLRRSGFRRRNAETLFRERSSQRVYRGTLDARSTDVDTKYVHEFIR